jgi:hypothetical protein
MKSPIHLLLAIVALAGFVHQTPPPVEADIVVYDFDVGPASSSTTDKVYQADGCEGIADHFAANPPPIGAIDAFNGREIIGWEVVCGEEIAAAGGTMGGPGGERIIPRSFGHIRVSYA